MSVLLLLRLVSAFCPSLCTVLHTILCTILTVAGGGDQDSSVCAGFLGPTAYEDRAGPNHGADNPGRAPLRPAAASGPRRHTWR